MYVIEIKSVSYFGFGHSVTINVPIKALLEDTVEQHTSVNVAQ